MPRNRSIRATDQGREQVNLLLEDNGKGFDPALSEDQHGAGLLNVRSRVDYLKGQLDIHSEREVALW